MNKQAGNAVVEFAFALPVFLILLLGIIEVNRYYWTSYWLTYGLHQAVEQEAIDPRSGVPQRFSSIIKKALLDPDKVVITSKIRVFGQLDINEWTAQYRTTFFFYDTKQLLVQASSWHYDNEQVIQ